MSKRILRNPRTAWRQYDDETLVITPDDRKVHKLNGTGTFIWTAIGETGIETTKLFEQMKVEFDADEQALKKDMEQFLEDLSGKGVLLVEGESTP